MKYRALIGRILFSLIFIISAFGHFQAATISLAASKGVPFATLLVPLSGILVFTGALSILTGYWTKWGAWLIVLFLIPVTFTMHAFWADTDPMMKQMNMVMFLKNLSLIGGAILLSYFGAGELSVDAKRAAQERKEI